MAGKRQSYELIPLEMLQNFFSYNKETGHISYRIYHRRKQPGTRAESTMSKYYCISINYYTNLAHISAYRLVTGEDIPEGYFIDHIDGDGYNNIWSNLRLATRAQNNYNSKLRIDNTSNIKGVSFHKRTGKWQASINANSQQLYFGVFPSKEEAAEVVRKYREFHHKDFANHG